MGAFTDITPDEQFIFVVGYPASGKTFYAQRLANELHGYKLIHTDDYMKYKWSEQLSEALNDLERYRRKNQPIIVEGVLAYRILRAKFRASVVITIHSTREERVDRYRERKENYNRTFESTLNKIWSDWLSDMDYNGISLPRMIDINKQ